jgi:hypothetical protein
MAWNWGWLRRRCYCWWSPLRSARGLACDHRLFSGAICPSLCLLPLMMDLSDHLSNILDFSHGEKFQKEVLHLFSTSVHHPSSSFDGSFFLLATFRRFIFCLLENSVSLAVPRLVFMSSFWVIGISDSQFLAEVLVFTSTLYVDSLVPHLMSLFISRTME